MPNGLENHFIYLFTVCMSSWVQCLFKSFAYLLFGLFVPLLLKVRVQVLYKIYNLQCSKYIC